VKIPESMRKALEDGYSDMTAMRFEEAAASYAEAVKWGEQKKRRHRQSEAWLRNYGSSLVSAYLGLAMSKAGLGDRETSTNFCNKALDIGRRLQARKYVLGEEKEGLDAALQKALEIIGGSSAPVSYSELIRVGEELREKEGASDNWASSNPASILATTYHVVGIEHLRENALQPALDNLYSARVILLRIQSIHQNSNDWLQNHGSILASNYTHISAALKSSGSKTEAEEALEAGVELWRRLNRNNPDHDWLTVFGHEAAEACFERAAQLSVQGKKINALELFNEAKATYESLSKIYPSREISSRKTALQIATIHSNIGCLLDEQGNFKRAIEEFDLCISVLESLRAQIKSIDQWLVRIDDVLSSACLNKGVALKRSGHPRAAIEFYNQAFDTLSKLLVACESSTEENLKRTMSISMALLNKGNALCDTGDFQEALFEYDRSLEIRNQIRSSFGDSEEWLLEHGEGLANAYDSLSTTLSVLEDYDSALRNATLAIEIRERLHTTIENSNRWTMGHVSDLAVSYRHRGLIYRAQNNNGGAIRDLHISIDLANRLRKAHRDSDQWLSLYGVNLAINYFNRGLALISEESPSDARSDLDQSISILRRLRKVMGDPADWIRLCGSLLATSWHLKAHVCRMLGQKTRGAIAFERSLMLFEELAKTRPLTFSELKLPALYWDIRLSLVGTSRMYFKSRSRAQIDLWISRMNLELERFPIRNAEAAWTSFSTASKRIVLRSFRYALVNTDFVWALELLQRLHGYALLQDALDAVDLEARDPDLLGFQHKRRDLFRIRQQLIDVLNRSTVGANSLDLNADQRLQPLAPSFAKSSERTERLQSEYHAALRQYEDARTKASKVHGFEALNPTTLALSLSQLQYRLPQHNAIVLLVEGVDDNPAQTMILDSGHTSHAAFPDLPLLATRLESVQRSLETGDSFRRAGTMQQPALSSDPLDVVSPKLGIAETQTDETIDDPVTAFLDLASALKDSFWIPLLAALPKDTTTVHLVTHGQLHSFPFASQTPAHITLYQYPGLVMFGQQHGLYPKMTVRTEQQGAEHALGLIAFPGSAHNYLDLVDAELAFLTQLWGADNVIKDWSTEPFTFGHIACHGDNRKGVHDTGHNEGVLLVQDRTGSAPFLGAREVRELAHRLPDELFVNACLCGQVSDDRTGTPTGLLIALMRKGVRSVIGALTPIDDHAAAWFAMLLHTARKASIDKTGTACTLQEAFNRAKTALLDPTDPLNLTVRRFMEAWTERWLAQYRQILSETGRSPIPLYEANQRAQRWRAHPDPLLCRFVTTSLVLFGRANNT